MTSAEKEQLDISWLYRCENLWQFRIGEGTPYQHSKSFSDSGRHSDVSLAEARAYRNAYLARHPEIRITRPPVWLALPKNNRSGILGVNYSERILPSGFKYAAWQMTCPRPNGTAPRTARFSTNRLGETRALMMAVQARRAATLDLISADDPAEDSQVVQKVIGEYDDIISELEQSLADGTDSEILSIIREARLDSTTKRSEISIRLGQHRFRRLVLAHWGGRCAVTGATIMLTASHIKPWSAASDFDRINPYNGIALSTLYDRAFDAGYISFGTDGTILVSSAHRDELIKLGIDLSARISGLKEDHFPYLQHHHDHVFREKRPNSR